MRAVKKVLTLLLILTIISQIFIPSNVKAQNTIRTYDSNSLYDEVAKNAVLDNKRSEYVASDTGIDFTQGASSTNGQGVYTIASTKDDLYPIHYYRGNIDNNNVLFGGFCWQIVRTTETGGVKLIYNGSPDENGKCEDTQMDWNLQTSNMQSGLYMYGNDIKNIIGERNNIDLDLDGLVDVLSENIKRSYFDFNIYNEDFYYSDEVEYSKETNKYTLKNAKHHNSGDSIDEIKEKKPTYICSYSEECFSIELVLWNIYLGGNYVDLIYLSNGITYDDVERIKKQNLIFANDVEYKNGHYELINTISIPLEEVSDNENIKKILNGYRYFCKDFTDSCDDVNFGYNFNSFFDYLVFYDGRKADDVYYELKNSTNEKNSEIKEVIDRWYSENLIDDTKYLEDTIWCNDRSTIANIFNKDFKLIDFDNINNLKLSHTCTNKNDQFTVSNKNGNGKLIYPIATITDREVVYAGSPSMYINESEIEPMAARGSTNYLSYYVYEYDYYRDFLTMTPYGFGNIYYSVDGYGELSYPENHCLVKPSSIKYDTMPIVCLSADLVRPMVSLKHSMIVSSGDGSPTNPYEVVEGNTVEYVIDGDMPNGFLPPEVESYLKGSKVKMNGLKAGDIINGYRFLGWHTEDVEVDGDTFDMPENKVVFVGKFEKIEDSPLTYDSISKYLTTGIIGVVGLAGFIIIKKKMLN